MATFVVTIQETICQNFDVEAGSAEEAVKIAEKLYKDAELVVENGEATEVELYAFDPDNPSEFVDGYVIQ